MARALATAAKTFERTLAELGISGRALGDPIELGRRGALLAAADVIWRERIGPLFEREHVQVLLGVRSRQAVHQLVKRRRLLGLATREGRLRFPAFQFSSSGAVYEAVPTILGAFEAAKLSPYSIASWFMTGQRLLRGTTPAAWLGRGGEPGRPIEAARRTAARLAH